MRDGANNRVVRTDLAAFLRARLDEDEAVAHNWDSDARARVAVMWTGSDPGYTTVAADNDDDVWVADGKEVVEPRHVTVLYDPARVLADVAAKRQLLRWATRWPMRPPKASDGIAAEDYILRLLAQPYADHEDFDRAWHREVK